MVGNLDWSDNFVDLFEVFELRREPSVHADDFFIDDRTDGHDVEAVRENLPEFEVVLAFT